MRKAALLSLVFVACGYATNAQLSVTPRVGLEQAFTCVQYNNTSGIKPMSSNFSPQIALRMDYLFNKAHGPFVGVASNRSVVEYMFTNPETGDKEFSSSHGDWKLRLEAGYQVSSKPIALSRNASQTSATKAPKAKQSPCAARLNNAKAALTQKPVMNMRIQPYAGMAFVPNAQTAISSVMQASETVYQYSAGNWNTAFITGVNFAFAKGNINKYVVGIQYLKGIGNMGSETLTTALDNKQLNTQLSSSAAAWNITVGMPLSFKKDKQVMPAKAVAPAKEPVKTATPMITEQPRKTEAPAPAKKSCGYYKSRCSKWQ
ncbi:hypothetical protein [Longitalea luteola]|uniref:hypothetical protein n=1 Tax=Longitalea luteola TaxID=2812563 RepID=UPI001A95B4ED|nr:hypothetical protein [Longitalea luteola]